MTKKEPTVSTAQALNDLFPQSMIPRILFEDPQLIVLSKPAGLLSQGEHRGDPNLVDWLRVYLGRPYVGMIHRLDRNTSGIMLVAKRTKSAQRLTLALQEGKIQRIYLAWLVGELTQTAHWQHFLQKSERLNKVSVVSSAQGKPSSLTVTPVKHLKWKNTFLTLARFKLETGRSHQIRVQASHEGFPLLGDSKYNRDPKTASFSRVALHSHHLEFFHPISGELFKFDDPLPEDLDL